MSSYDPFEVFGDDDEYDDNDHNKECDNTNNTVKQQEDETTTTTHKQHQLPVVSSLEMTTTNSNNANETGVVNSKTGGTTTSCNESNDDIFNVNDAIDIQNELNLIWGKPLYVNESKIVFVSSFNEVGGNRGVIAKKDIQPGTLVLIEEPLVVWDQQHDNDDDEFILLLSILQNSILIHPNVKKILYCLELFHPTKVCVDNLFDELCTATNCTSTVANMMINKTIIIRRKEESIDSTINEQEQIVNIIEDFEKRYQNNNNNIYDKILNSINEKIVEFFLYNSYSTTHSRIIISRLDIYRILLSIRYNGLQSGIYLYSALFNHSDQYNCVKFLPKTNTKSTKGKQQQNEKINHNNNYSEVRTTRFIPKGTSLTISYIPNILCHKSRRNYLWKQHRFDIGNTDMITNNNQLRQMELIHNVFPISSLSVSHPTTIDDNNYHMDDNNDTIQNSSNDDDHAHLIIIAQRIEYTIDEMKQMYHDYSTTKTTTEIIQALEVSVNELCLEAVNQLHNDNHILLIPCRQLHLDVCYLLLQQVHHADDNSNNNESFVHIIPLVQRMIITSQILIRLQEILLGVDHYDLARTYLDLAQSIDTLLSKSPNSLLHLNDESGIPLLRTTTEWMSLEYKARQQYKRIQILYPNDAEKYIK